MDDLRVDDSNLARAAGVDIDAVDSWIRGESMPAPTSARRAADALDCDPQDLWPDIFPTLQPLSTGTAAVSVYTRRTDIPAAAWTSFFARATEAIDILVYSGTFLFEDVPRFAKTLSNAASRGAQIRFLSGDPDTSTAELHGLDEQRERDLTGRRRMTYSRVRALSNIDGLSVRVHDNPAYTPLFRADNALITTPHLYGAPAGDSPAMLIRRDDTLELWNNHQQTFERAWNKARAMARTGP
ncbi:helix-turn-helix domain-containing protein [Mycobacteroides sp. PCS013]|uniref:helix-turn-helix domain-containing protein n=1 Tax=Mycobacteroides sp. PCS013 TaxID=3074106 RepID=UPI003C2BE2F2